MNDRNALRNLSPSDVVKLYFIFEYNGTEHPNHTMALFEFHARINHSCSPNAAFQGDGKTVALRVIRPGEGISISYLDGDELVMSTAVRRRILNTKYGYVRRPLLSLQLSKVQGFSCVWGYRNG
jgi:hypothetical protein